MKNTFCHSVTVFAVPNTFKSLARSFQKASFLFLPSTSTKRPVAMM